MKRVFSIILTLFLFTGIVFAEDQGDEYDDGYVYENNGAGDQFLKIGFGAIVPLNFVVDGQNKLYTGGTMEMGYYRFLNEWLALGGEFAATYDVSIGEKILIMIPVTFGALFQPSYNKFEFPIYVTAGFGYESWQNSDYFPSLVTKVSAGAYYRINEMCSVGLSTSFMWVPQWYSDSKYNSNGLFENIYIGARYHF